MLTFTVLLPPKSSVSRVYVYNQYGDEVAQCASLNDVFSFFYHWCVKFNGKSVTYTFTKDKDVLLVKMV